MDMGVGAFIVVVLLLVVCVLDVDVIRVGVNKKPARIQATNSVSMQIFSSFLQSAFSIMSQTALFTLAFTAALAVLLTW